MRPDYTGQAIATPPRGRANPIKNQAQGCQPASQNQHTRAHFFDIVSVVEPASGNLYLNKKQNERINNVFVKNKGFLGV